MKDIKNQVWATVYAQEYLRQRAGVNGERKGHPVDWGANAACAADIAVECMLVPQHEAKP